MGLEEKEYVPSAETYNTRYGFENFVVGPSNKMAYKVCLEVARAPRNIEYGSVYIYGRTGTGKTHLARAIQNEIMKNNDGVKVIYATAERFTYDFIKALKSNRTSKCKDYYRSADVLIIDDLQDLPGRKHTSELLFKTIRDFRMGGRQIILIADKRPDDLGDLSEKDLSILKWGLMVEVYQPEYYTAKEIIRYYAKKNEIENVLSDELCNYMINNLSRNPRVYMAAINKLTLYQSQTDKNYTFADVVKILEDLKKQDSLYVDTESIMSVVANYYDIPVSKLKSSSRIRKDTMQRRISMYLCKKYTSDNFAKIAKSHGRVDASSAFVGCKYIEKKIEEDTYLAKDVRNIIEVLKKM